MGLAAIEAHFNQSHIVPDLLSAFQPQAVLGVNFGEFQWFEVEMPSSNLVKGAGDIQPGQKFTIEGVFPFRPCSSQRVHCVAL